MAIQDDSWSLVEMNYTLSLVVAVPKGSGGHTLPPAGVAVCDGQSDYMCRNNIVNRDNIHLCTTVYNTWLVGSY